MDTNTLHISTSFQVCLLHNTEENDPLTWFVVPADYKGKDNHNEEPAYAYRRVEMDLRVCPETFVLRRTSLGLPETHPGRRKRSE
jgi:hypothetical protein